jgi:hypothetical protein
VDNPKNKPPDTPIIFWRIEMKKIKDGTYRAMRCDASGYVYGSYRGKRGNNYYIKEQGQDDWVTPIKIKTLVYRKDGKWLKENITQNTAQ